LLTKCLIAIAQGTLIAGMALFSISQNVIFSKHLEHEKLWPLFGNKPLTKKKYFLGFKN
jgi:hypothetical protein